MAAAVEAVNVAVVVKETTTMGRPTLKSRILRVAAVGIWIRRAGPIVLLGRALWLLLRRLGVRRIGLLFWLGRRARVVGVEAVVGVLFRRVRARAVVEEEVEAVLDDWLAVVCGALWA
jgi:hypothetical protein